eukprot:1150826-Pelagomonas_calceolata.AAC.1
MPVWFSDVLTNGAAISVDGKMSLRKAVAKAPLACYIKHSKQTLMKVKAQFVLAGTLISRDGYRLACQVQLPARG